MPDAVDIANDLADREREAAIASRVALAKAADSLTAHSECLDCGEQIDPARRAALPRTSRCIDCATDYEGRSKHARIG